MHPGGSAPRLRAGLCATGGTGWLPLRCENCGLVGVCEKVCCGLGVWAASGLKDGSCCGGFLWNIGGASAISPVSRCLMTVLAWADCFGDARCMV